MRGKIAVAVVALLMFLAGNASADLTSSKHNLSVPGGEPCAYCHRVHHSVGGLGRPAYMGPLPYITQVYTSDTLDHTIDETSVNISDAPLCLTCHDSTTVDTMMLAGDEKTTIQQKLIDRPEINITLDLRNDHPVGFVFDANLYPEDEIQAPTDSRVHVSFGPGLNEMWCSSCHNPHGGEPGTPLLAMSNDASALCLQCHIK